ncbi:type II toxin-antitoxin system RelE/ParE family toxin [Brumimicrobium glaciale]|uniref:type II toxin-antitoxin system RelE/ParE family toxin n=1 Tax=Brumimicrobium glaciale TaxID=200475 RepID=UPI001F5C1404|nr:type II toxin-antitoxin system RelE/ParE family toxin [Brumimicrobium glaciale]
MKYKISVRGLIDLDEIWLYTFEEWSIEQADIYINSILDKIDFLSKTLFKEMIIVILKMDIIDQK